MPAVQNFCNVIHSGNALTPTKPFSGAAAWMRMVSPARNELISKTRQLPKAASAKVFGVAAYIPSTVRSAWVARTSFLPAHALGIFCSDSIFSRRNSLRPDTLFNTHRLTARGAAAVAELVLQRSIVIPCQLDCVARVNVVVRKKSSMETLPGGYVNWKRISERLST